MSTSPARFRRRVPALLTAGTLSLVGLLTTALAAPTAMATPTTGSTAAPAVSTPYGAYVPLAPARVLDTRRSRPVGSAQTITTSLAGHGGLPAAGAISAVVVNLTAVSPSSSGYLTAYPGDIVQQRPNASSLNTTPGITVANLVTIPIHADGSIKIFNSAGLVNVIVDVLGYYSAVDPLNGDGGYTKLDTPTRKFDSRSTTEFTGGAPFSDGDGVDLPYDFGTAAMNQAVTAVVVSVTVTAPTANGYVVTWNGLDADFPPTSTLNFTRGKTVANLAIVPASYDSVNDDALITAVVSVPGGTAHVIIDTVGVMTTTDPAAAPDDARFVPLAQPTRLIDTRISALGGPSLVANGIRSFGLGALGQSSTYAFAGNVTAVAPPKGTFLTLYPSDVARPGVSNLNAAAGQVVASGAIVSLVSPTAQPPRQPGDEFRIYSSGATNAILDVAGTFEVPVPVNVARQSAATPAARRVGLTEAADAPVATQRTR